MAEDAGIKMILTNDKLIKTEFTPGHIEDKPLMSWKIYLKDIFVENNFDSIFDYAITINRLPVYVYEADLSGKLLQHIQDKFNDGEYFIHRKDASVPDSAKVVYITKPVREPIPLLVSSAGMIYGGEKELMIQRAEKIVYCAAEVYNKKGNSGVKSFAG